MGDKRLFCVYCNKVYEVVPQTGVHYITASHYDPGNDMSSLVSVDNDR